MPSLNQRVMVAGAAVLIIIGALAGAGMYVASDLKGELADQGRASEVLRHHMEADMMHDALRGDVLRAIIAGEPASGISSDEVSKDIEEHSATFRTALKTSRSQATEPEQVALLESLKQPIEEYISAANDMVKLGLADPVAARKALPRFQDQFGVLEDKMGKASDAIGDHAAKAIAKATAAAVLAQQVMTGLLVVAVAFGLGLIVLARRIFVAPIIKLTADMRQLAAGRTDISLRGANRDDELGEISRAVRAFQDVIVERTNADARAAEAQRLSEAAAEQRAAVEQAERSRQQQKVMDGIAEGLDRLANGDLVFRLNDPFPSEYEPLRSDFNGALGRLQETMRGFLHAVQGVQGGASEINSAAADLSRRTEQQAASLEETAAALDQITSTVRQTADGASVASTVVQETRHEAESSEAIVREAVGAMGEIDQSSRQISQIIGVIDEIAFQTNLLALNAGVEAARAGDAGRGFAVVATEVRALAQRSAEAAKEIKSLISASGAQVERGVDLVGRAGKALEHILQRVARIADLNAEIAGSAKQQAIGLDEVNRAVNHMDQVTQQNAAMVEQTTAASHSLLEEAHVLGELAARFRVDAGGVSRPRSAA